MSTQEKPTQSTLGLAAHVQRRLIIFLPCLWFHLFRKAYQPGIWIQKICPERLANITIGRQDMNTNIKMPSSKQVVEVFSGLVSFLSSMLKHEFSVKVF